MIGLARCLELETININTQCKRLIAPRYMLLHCIDPAGITIGHASGNILIEADFGENGEWIAATVFRTA